MPKSESTQQKRRRAAEVLDRLRRQIPDLRCELDFSTSLELAVAAILAAQCTDKRVNMVTPALFRKYRSARDYAQADPAELEALIKTTGFFRNKAKSIRALGAALVERHGGELPRELDKLIGLPGIGRKTANLIVAEAFGQPGLIIDTHQIRLNRRLGFTAQRDATKIEMELRKLLPEQDWTDWSHALTLHGRYTCLARAPKCGECPLTDLCPFFAASARTRDR
jgi:endonuclease-3